VRQGPSARSFGPDATDENLLLALTSTTERGRWAQRADRTEVGTAAVCVAGRACAAGNPKSYAM